MIGVGQFKIPLLLPPQAVRDTPSCLCPGSSRYCIASCLPWQFDSSRYCILSFPRQFEILHHSPSSSRYCSLPLALAVQDTVFPPSPGNSRYCILSLPRQFELLHCCLSPLAVRGTACSGEIKKQRGLNGSGRVLKDVWGLALSGYQGGTK